MDDVLMLINKILCPNVYVVREMGTFYAFQLLAIPMIGSLRLADVGEHWLSAL